MIVLPLLVNLVTAAFVVQTDQDHVLKRWHGSVFHSNGWITFITKRSFQILTINLVKTLHSVDTMIVKEQLAKLATIRINHVAIIHNTMRLNSLS